MIFTKFSDIGDSLFERILRLMYNSNSDTHTSRCCRFVALGLSSMEFNIFMVDRRSAELFMNDVTSRLRMHILYRLMMKRRLS